MSHGVNERDGHCYCGCGRKTPLAPYSRSARGWKKGEHVRYLPGHHLKRYQGAGEENPGWNGGRWIHTDGYVRVYVPGGGYALEHVQVAEEALGRALPEGAVVHHVDGDRANNDPANLVVCQDPAYHNLLHARQRAADACGNPNAVPCSLCGGYENQADMWYDKKRRTGRHRTCSRAYEQEKAASARSVGDRTPRMETR